MVEPWPRPTEIRCMRSLLAALIASLALACASQSTSDSAQRTTGGPERTCELPAPLETPQDPADPELDPLAEWTSEEGRRGTSNDGAWHIKYRTLPTAVPLNDEFGLEVAVFAADGTRPGEVELAVDAAMPHHRHGMLQIPVVERRPDGVFTVEGLLFHMPGYWELYFDVTVDGITERTQFVVELD